MWILVIKFTEHYINNLSTFKIKILINIYVKLKLINLIHLIITIYFNMFNIVNKTIVLRHKIKNMKDIQYDKGNTNLYIYYTF